MEGRRHQGQRRLFIDPPSVGQAITILVEVHWKAERIDLSTPQKFGSRRHPKCSNAITVTGDADFVLVITVPTMTAYEALTRDSFFENANVKRFRTLVVMDR